MSSYKKEEKYDPEASNNLVILSDYEDDDDDDEDDDDDILNFQTEENFDFGFDADSDHEESMTTKDHNDKFKLINLNELAKRHCRINPDTNIEPVKKPSYHEYNIQPKNKSFHKEPLKQIRDLPHIVQEAFKGYKTLNTIQSRIYDKALNGDENMLVCAPTGAGKTNVAFLCMIREMMKYLEKKEKFKIIYIAPIKALAQEVVNNFNEKLERFNMKVDEFTGDSQLDQREIDACHLIVSTPEKWDILTRKGTERPFTKEVKLVIFDEIHLLHNDRGPVLEALITRIKRNKQVEGEPIRILSLTATLPNYLEVAQFINSPATSTFFFDSSYRPIPLRLQFIAITETHKQKSAKVMDDIVYEKVIERVKKHQQILVFVHSRNDTVKTALFLKDSAFAEDKTTFFNSSGRDFINMIEEMDQEQKFEERWRLKELLQFAIGIHHAGMCKEDRTRVENLFRDKHIKVLVCTATLAWGVNLPARTVIIKGTRLYVPEKGGMTDLDSLDVMQMLGRAGRPQYDSEGEGIIITDQKSVQYYMSLMNEQLPVESQLIAKLSDYLNAECVSGTVEGIEDGVQWLSESFLCSRMRSILKKRNKPYMSIYGIDSDAEYTDPNLDKHLHNLVYSAFCRLDECNLIDFDRKAGLVTSTELGRIASFCNCTCNTIKTFNDSSLLPAHSTEIELFRTFSLADEFKHIVLRADEEQDMQALINEVPHPINRNEKYTSSDGVKLAPQKVNALLQCYIYDKYIKDSAIVADMRFIQDSASRLMHAIFEIALFKKYAELAELTLLVCKKIERAISECHTPLWQVFDEIRSESDAWKAEDILKRIQNKNEDLNTWRSYNVSQMNEILRTTKIPKVGSRVCAALKLLPKLEIDLEIFPLTDSTLQLNIGITPRFTWKTKYHGYSERFWILVCDVNGENLLTHEQVRIQPFREVSSDKVRKSKKEEEKKQDEDEKRENRQVVKILLPSMNLLHPFYYVKVKSDRWFGCDSEFPLRLENLKLPKNENIITPLNDEKLVNIDCIQNEIVQGIYRRRFEGTCFNNLQSQVFGSIYESNADVLFMAAQGSGKKTCAELAFIRNSNIYGDDSKVCVVCVNEQSATFLQEFWSSEFKDSNIKFVTLSGNFNEDFTNILKRQNLVVIGDYRSWNTLTLAQTEDCQDVFNQFQLFIINDLHHARDDQDSTFEWLCTKIKINNLERKNSEINQPRIVAFGVPVNCAKDLRRWLLAQKKKNSQSAYVVYNFSLNDRPVRLDLTFQKFFSREYYSRLTAMQRPLYRNILKYSAKKPVIVYVANRHQAKIIADRLYVYSKNDEIEFFCSPPESSFLSDSSMKKFLMRGVAYIHEETSSSDKKIIQDWFTSGQVGVLIVTAPMAFCLSVRSYLTIIMNLEYPEEDFGRIPSEEYTMTEIFQMVGSTGRPLIDHESRCILMCQSAQAEIFQRMLQEPLALESSLHRNLHEHVKLEIAAHTIDEVDEILNPFVVFSFFSKRVKVNPNYYNFSDDEEEIRTDIYKLIEEAVEYLCRNKYIKLNEKEEESRRELKPRSKAKDNLAKILNG